MTNPSPMQKYLVEFIGTFFFLSVIIFTGHPLAIGAALALSIYVGGKISGGNFNPAVTIMMAVGDKMPIANAVPYIIAQIAGGLLALQIYLTFKKSNTKLF
jgi:aquaporin Z